MPRGSVLEPILSIFLLLICQILLKVMNVYFIHSLIEKSSKFEAWRLDVCSTCNTLVFTYTNESLQNINKKDLILIILSLQNKLEEVNNNVLVEMRRLNESFCKL